jgi:RHS repeat-associated protein
VKKYVPGTGETTVFVYDAAGKEIAEYSTIVANSTVAKVNYLTTDHLGSPRINTDQNGAVIARHDYMPFGEEISNIGGRNNGSDTVRKQFTGYERDHETDLDFAQARMFGYSVGRFTSPDDFLKDTKPIEPASWNLYVFVRNNPLKYIDSSGESVNGTGLSDEERTRLIAEFARVTGYRVEDLSFGSDGLLTIASGAKTTGGSATAKRLLNEAINSSWEFMLVGVNTTDVAFAEHAPVPGSPRFTTTGQPQSHYVGQVRIDFADFNNAVFEDDKARQAFSLGIAVLHEFVHGLYPNLDDHLGGGAGEIENNWINPIRKELGLATRDVYDAPIVNFTNQTGQAVKGPQLSFSRYEYGPLKDPTFKNPFPEEGTYPVTSHVYWQMNTVGGKKKTN